MDLQQLRYVVSLGKELNFNRAAKQVGISQPTLSQQVKKLEDELGVPLFERSAHHVHLTPSGRKFLPFALSALDTIRSGVKEIHEGRDTLRGRTSLAFIPTIGPYLLPALLKHLKKSAPELTLELYEETTSTLVQNLKSAVFDLGILALPINDASLVTRPLGEEEFFLAVPHKHRLSTQKQIAIDAITDEKFLMLQEGHCFRDQALDFCRTNRAEPRIVFEGSSLVSVMNLTASGEGITFVPKMAVEVHGHSKLHFIPFSNPKPKREIGVIWRMTSALDLRARFIVDAIEKILKEMK